MLSIISIIVGCILFLIVAWYFSHYKFFNSLKNIKGPTPLPLIGNALEFKGPTTLLSDFTRLFGQYGKCVKLVIGLEPIVLIADYKAIEATLNSTRILEKSSFYRFLHNWLNLGLLTSSGEKWKKRRRILTPAYHFQILEEFVPIFNKVGNILVEEFSKEKNKDSVDVYPYITLSTLDVICETAMGVPVNAQVNKTSPYVQSVKEMGRIIMDRSFNPQQQYDVFYQFTKNYKTEQKCLKILHGHTTSVINKRKRELANKKARDATEDEFGAKKRFAFLDLLIQTTENGRPLTDQAIREEVDTFMFEGHDTTASGISFALFAIANNPEVQAKILEEQREIFGDEKREITYNDLSQMKYLDMVIKETLRLYPPVPFFGRQTTDTTDLGNGVIVPEGFTITVAAHQIQRDPEYFKNPDVFDPERFLPENNVGKTPYSYIPFSAGPRNCIGQKFALLEMKSTITKVVQSFELLPTTPAHKLHLASETILKSDNGIFIKIKKRS